MRRVPVALLPLLLLVAHVALADVANDGYVEEDGMAEALQPGDMDEYSYMLANMLRNSAQKRSCISRGRSCDTRRRDCCNGGTCRCNLWGANCKCMRGGLFQAWGRRRK